MPQEILYENLQDGVYQTDGGDYISENFKYNLAEFNKLYVQVVRLPDGKGNVIYLMTDTFDHALNMIANKNFVLPPSYKRFYYPTWYTCRFMNQRIVVNTKSTHMERRKMISQRTKLRPIQTRSLPASTDNVIFCTSDIVSPMMEIMMTKNAKRNYTEFYPAYIGALKELTPNPIKESTDDRYNNRLVIIDSNSFTFKNGAPIKDNIANPLFLLYLAYMRNRELTSLNIDIDMMICNKNLFMKFNPSRISDNKTWGQFRRALFRIMDVDLDKYMDELSEEDKAEVDTISNKITVSAVVKDTVDLIAKDASTSTKNALADVVEDQFVRHVTDIAKKDHEIKLSQKGIKQPEPDKEKDTFKAAMQKSVMSINPVVDPLDNKREKLFKSIASDYSPLMTKSNLTIDDDYDEYDSDYDDERPEDSEYDEDDAKIIEDDVLDIISNDPTVAAELMDSIQNKVVPINDVEKSPVNTARDKKLREEQKKQIVKNSTIGEILERDTSNVPIETDDKSAVMHTSNQNMKNITFANFNKTYLDSVYTKDVLSCFNMLIDKESPFYITGIEVKDTSDALNYIETWTVHLTDENKKRSTIKVDLPKFQNERFMYLEGTRWIINNQNFYNPLVKDTPDTVIITTNYNKVTVRRKSTKSLGVVERIFSLIKKTGDTKMFVTGNSSTSNMRFISTLEYDELSQTLFKYTSGKCTLYFSRNYIQDNLSDKIPRDIKGDEFYIGHEGNTPVLINEDTGLDRTGRTIAEIIEENLPDDYKSIYASIKGGKQMMYVEGKLAGEFIPIITTLVVWIGITKALNEMGIEWKFNPGMKRVPMASSSRRYVRFADGVLEYEAKIFAELILNGLAPMKPEKFNFADFDSEVSYDDFIYSQWGSYNGITELKNFYEFLVDPITKDVCRDMLLPETSQGLLIMAVQLLADNKFVSKASDQSYRTRSIETIPAILYSQLASQYKKYVKSGRRTPMTLNRKCVISALIGLKTVEAYSTLNPVLEIGKTHSISTKGYRGSNSEHSYNDEKKRSYDPTSIGKLALTTSADANVGVTKSLVIEPTIANARGYRKQVDDINELKDVNVFSPVEMLTPGSARMDDPIRTAIASKQSSHVVPVQDASPSLVSNGFDEAVQFHLSDDFVINADEDGKIIDVNDELGFVMVQYKSGKTRAIYTKPEIVNNSGGGFFMSNKLVPTHTKVGELFKKDEPLAYHPNYFKYSKMNGLRYAIGPRVKMAIASTFNTYEDGGISTEEFGERMATKIVYREYRGFKRNNNILSMAKIGDHVNVGDVLIKYDVSTEDDELSKFLGRLSDTSADIISEEARDEFKTKHAGEVIDIKIYSLLDPQTLSPSLGKVVKEHFDKGINKKEYLEKFDSTDGTMKSGYLLKDTTEPIVNKYNMINGQKGIDVLIEFYVEHSDTMGVGDKVAQYNANKQIISQLIPKGFEPYSEFRPDEIISSLSSPGTIARRMTPSVICVMAVNKVLIEMKRYLVDNFSKMKRPAIEKLIYDVYMELDPSGTNTDKFKVMFNGMNDTEFKKFFEKFLKDPNEDFMLDIVEFEHSMKFEYCENAAKVLGIPLMEYVYMPHLTMDKKRVIVTKEKCLVGYINVKRTQQLLAKKNGLSLSNDKRSSMTGQVISTSTHKDKNARDSDIEATMLVSLGADRILQELHGPRADDLVMKRQMNKSIATNGYVLLDELDNLSTNKVTLNTVNTYLVGMMLKSDLVSSTDILPKTSNEIFESVDNDDYDDELPYAAWM